MGRVAKEVGITPMAIYHHFPSREDLLGAVLDSEFAKVAEFLNRPTGTRVLKVVAL